MKFPMLYTLDAKGNPKPEPSGLAWGRWFESHTKERQVALTKIGRGKEVSTIFLGIDHNFGIGGKPVLWETMFFCPDGEDQMRCSGSREQAEAMHHEMVKRVKAKQKVKR